MDNHIDPVRRFAEAFGDASVIAIVHIAGDPGLSVHDRLDRLARLDNRFFAKSSHALATLLGCTPPAVRQTHWWRIDRIAYLSRDDGGPFTLRFPSRKKSSA